MACSVASIGVQYRSCSGFKLSAALKWAICPSVTTKPAGAWRSAASLPAAAADMHDPTTVSASAPASIAFHIFWILPAPCSRRGAAYSKMTGLTRMKVRTRQKNDQLTNVADQAILPHDAHIFGE